MVETKENGVAYHRMQYHNISLKINVINNPHDICLPGIVYYVSVNYL